MRIAHGIATVETRGLSCQMGLLQLDTGIQWVLASVVYKPMHVLLQCIGDV